MPFRRRSTFRRKFKPRAPPKSRFNRYAGYAVRALKIATAVRGLVNSEKHVHDVALTSAIDSTGTVTGLSLVAQGDDISGRTGRSIMVKSVQMKSTIASHASATASRVRTIIFSDSMNQGSTPEVTDILAAANPEAMRNVLTEGGRFKVLYDSIAKLDNVSNKQYTIDKYLPLGNHHVLFEGTAAANVGKGSLWLLRISNEATNTVSQNTNVRIRFYDN